MKRTRNIIFAALLVGSMAPGCRIDPGETDYESQPLPEEEDMGMEQEFLPGPDPYAQGESRISFGPFYEGSGSDEIPVDDVNNYFFVFDGGGSGSLDITVSDDRIEGFQSSRFELLGTPFWGMNVAWLTGNPSEGGVPRPEDMSMWDTFHISFKSSDVADFSIGIATAGGDANVQASAYGYTADGEWHTLEIPLDDFTEDRTAVTGPIILSSAGGNAGDVLLVDNFYYTAD